MEQLAEGYGLIEGPRWHDRLGLVFADVVKGGVQALSPDGTLATVVPHRKGIGGIALHAGGGFVITGRNVALKPADGGETRVLLAADEATGETGFNDLATDAAGRILVGSLAFRPTASGYDDAKPGRLYRIDLDGTAEAVSDGILLTNGLAFSADGRRLYHSDSLNRHVRVYDVAPDGAIGSWRVFAEMPRGIPDGMAAAADGRLLVALAHGHAVAVFRPDGSLEREIAVPQPMVTSLCFGGDGLEDLYVVTGTERDGPADAGTVWRTRAGIAGLPVPPARVPA